MWYQLIDDLDTWPESYCTSMFLFSMCEGIRIGILPADPYAETVVKGWQGLSDYIDADWRINEVCAGTSFQNDRDGTFRKLDYEFFDPQYAASAREENLV
jgi:rhamnogalacturonyl hydrolase YesR